MTNEIAKSTRQIILRLYNDGNENKGVLASLRTAPKLTSPRAQSVWPVMLGSIPETMLSRDGQPTKAEKAVYAAVRLYAIHQQAQSTFVYDQLGWKHQDENGEEKTKGKDLFAALALIRANPDYKDALDRRVQAVLATTNIDAVFDALGHLVSMLKARSAGVQVDYGQLAQDFYQFQFGYTAANRIRLRWGQQYFFVQTDHTQTKGE
ncbi:type I-E CRISPR-associated protein Cse2/CasB [Lactiplantibacillus plajomi]|uniref:Type I-E CRISPR-associated protein Cse2/CasB n=1 Tax=Lactiplantibacillus plajomi TaxID=1457217 RepID=A0ABV6K2F0_9LACO|nr:type I-E CRISPR-associated protein Cse2/CasB [Lactiplantibacillus plajomi]